MEGGPRGAFDRNVGRQGGGVNAVPSPLRLGTGIRVAISSIKTDGIPYPPADERRRAANAIRSLSSDEIVRKASLVVLDDFHARLRCLVAAGTAIGSEPDENHIRGGTGTTIPPPEARHLPACLRTAGEAHDALAAVLDEDHALRLLRHGSQT